MVEMLFTPAAQHKVKKYPLEGTLKGISDRQIQEHRDILYAGYVNKLNEIETKQKDVAKTGNGTHSDYRELKLEEAFAVNGVFLHEAYFENIDGKGGTCDGAILKLINRDFGSYDAWKEDFVAASASSRGWVVLALNLLDGRVHNYLCDRHDLGGIWWCLPLLVLDVYEHAYMIDYGVKRADYIKAFFDNISWTAVNSRIEQIKKISKIVEK